ncbi:hypothetical protein LTR53_001854 [Teratosphaeriaceae sp. CCFEE 6253]|nr:hypothetical protein LTR53_001854 [Teratosphaeriaceae sp. CCFEE 6253]
MEYIDTQLLALSHGLPGAFDPALGMDTGATQKTSHVRDNSHASYSSSAAHSSVPLHGDMMPGTQSPLTRATSSDRSAYHSIFPPHTQSASGPSEMYLDHPMPPCLDDDEPFVRDDDEELDHGRDDDVSMGYRPYNSFKADDPVGEHPGSGFQPNFQMPYHPNAAPDTAAEQQKASDLWEAMHATAMPQTAAPDDESAMLVAPGQAALSALGVRLSAHADQIRQVLAEAMAPLWLSNEMVEAYAHTSVAYVPGPYQADFFGGMTTPAPSVPRLPSGRKPQEIGSNPNTDGGSQAPSSAVQRTKSVPVKSAKAAGKCKDFVHFDPHAEVDPADEKDPSDVVGQHTRLHITAISIPGQADRERISGQTPELDGAPSVRIQLPADVGVVEMLMLMPHHTQRPRFLLRLLGNGWKYADIAAVQLWARGTSVRAINEALVRYNNRIRRQALEIGPEEFPATQRWKPSVNLADVPAVTVYSTADYRLKANAGAEQDATLASLGRGVIELDWPGVKDSGILIQAVRWAMGVNGDLTKKVSDIPTLATLHGWTMPTSASSSRWDQRAMRRIVKAMIQDGVDIKLPA